MSNTVDHSHKAADFTVENSALEDSSSVQDSEKQAAGTNASRHEDEKLLIDTAAEKALLWKLDTRLIPLLFALYLMSYMDRSNVGNAKIAGMSKALKFDAKGNDYAWLLTIFYIGYIVFEWLALMWKVVPPHIWAATMVLGFGGIAALQSVTTSWSGMMALRFLLGSFEAGFGPGVPYYLTFFYLRQEIGLRIGLFLSAGPLATCFAGALAYGITSGHVSIANWRLLFLVEGLPSVALAAVAFFYLPDSTFKAKFLSPEDKEVAEARAVRQVGGDVSGATNRVGSVVWKDIGAALFDYKNYLTAMMYFSCNVSFSSLPVFLPTVLTEMGYTAVNAQGLSAPPYFLSFLVVIASTFIADKTGQRGIIIMILSLIGAVGYIILGATSKTAVRYFAVYLASIGIFPAIINILPWILNNQGSDTKRGAGIAITNLVGQCGPLLGTRIYPATGAPYYREGMWTCAAFMLFNGFLAIVLRTLLARENKKRDAKYGVVEKSEGTSSAGVENDGPNFRYIL
ncbi:related to nicotinamide mononucleotide permease [Phialocephala subalpina]|uniref:Related to nicotinamide mononucleotide permease n=1 Tax=Phialocephala subalpina TaxID=576137 RepID=A0A1L7X8Z7_9HELO|nr:related to nicotinamide mononucleotide permease [Phialocephala subalpina]